MSLWELSLQVRNNEDPLEQIRLNKQYEMDYKTELEKSISRQFIKSLFPIMGAKHKRYAK